MIMWHSLGLPSTMHTMSPFRTHHSELCMDSIHTLQRLLLSQHMFLLPSNGFSNTLHGSKQPRNVYKLPRTDKNTMLTSTEAQHIMLQVNGFCCPPETSSSNLVVLLNFCLTSLDLYRSLRSLRILTATICRLMSLLSN